jgi:hypothetical protein
MFGGAEACLEAASGAKLLYVKLDKLGVEFLCQAKYKDSYWKRALKATAPRPKGVMPL